MKTIAIFLLIFGACLLTVLKVCRPNFVDRAALHTPGGLSNWLTYSIEFHPAKGAQEAKFTAALTNISPYTLNILLNAKKFHASFSMKSKTGREFKVFDREYRHLLLTSVWGEPVTALAPSNSVMWNVPLTSLVGELDAPVTEESLSGCTVSSDMDMGILPIPMLENGFVENNATQKSKPIQIPLRNKTDAGNGSDGIGRVIGGCQRPPALPFGLPSASYVAPLHSRSPSPDR